MTTGSPPSIIATQLLVVPRSIPITLAIFQNLWEIHNHVSAGFNVIVILTVPTTVAFPRALGDCDPRRAEQAIADLITAMKFIHNGVWWMLTALNLIDRLMA